MSPKSSVQGAPAQAPSSPRPSTTIGVPARAQTYPRGTIPRIKAQSASSPGTSTAAPRRPRSAQPPAITATAKATIANRITVHSSPEPDPFYSFTDRWKKKAHRTRRVRSFKNKDRPRQVDDFAYKAVDALTVGVHLLLADLFAPGPHDPGGMHAAIRQRLERADQPLDDAPAAEPLTLAAYEAAPPCVEMYVERLNVGQPLAPMPLFLRPNLYVDVPLEPTYQSAFRAMPAFWRDVLEGRAPRP